MKRLTCRLSLVIIVSLLVSAPRAQTLEPIRYTLSFPAPHTHYVEVEASIPAEGRPSIDLMMPVWTPGSYLVREYSRHVEAISASDASRAPGSPLRIEKTRKNRWRVSTNGTRTVTLRYRVYAHEMSVRTNWVDDEFALINGAPTFLTLVESRPRPHEVRVVLPAIWARSLSGMPAGTEPNTFSAPNYDALVDAPIVAGNPAIYEFSAAGKPHYLVDFRERGVWNGAQAVRDLEKIVRKTAELWSDVPYERYYFFNIIGSSNNGLEHKNSTVISTERDSTASRHAYLEWLSYASHEYFHAWNVKRLRPIELGPFDYENEVYTKALWFVEGVTDYFADLQIHRAGVSSRDEYLESLSSAIRTLQTTPGRLVQSAEMASYDAWIKYYRQDENSPNTSISYYVKGSVLGFLLDAKIRRLTSGTKSLDDLLRLMYARFSGARGFTNDDLRSAIVEVAGSVDSTRGRSGGPAELRTWLARVLETTDELDYAEAVDWFGLRMLSSSTAPRAWLGVATRSDNGRTVVTEVRRGSPAYAAGMSVNDEILSINGNVVTPDQLASRVGQFTPGTSINLVIKRHDVSRSLAVTLATDPGHGWSLSVSPAATAEQGRRMTAWLNP